MLRRQIEKNKCLICLYLFRTFEAARLYFSSNLFCFVLQLSAAVCLLMTSYRRPDLHVNDFQLTLNLQQSSSSSSNFIV